MKSTSKTIIVLLMTMVVLIAGSCSSKKSTEAEDLPAIGDIITLGNYHWVVLDKKTDDTGPMALVLSQDVIFYGIHYDNQTHGSTWSSCSLRSYLNNEFYNEFSESDRYRICTVTNVNLNNQWYGTNGGPETEDKIFMLSLEEIVRYFGDSGQLAHQPPGTNMINDQYNDRRIALWEGRPCIWMLRSPGQHVWEVAFVYGGGWINMSGMQVNQNIAGIRPAVWIRI